MHLLLISGWLLALFSFSAALTLPETDRARTVCSINRGNSKHDTKLAIDDVLRKLGATKQASLEHGKCIYSRAGSTAASICGTKTSDSIVTWTQAETAFDHIFTSCGLKNNYNGAHYADGLTFNIYGVASSNELVQSHVGKRNAQSGWMATEDSGSGGSGSGGSGSGGSAALGEVVSKMGEICPNFQFTGKSRYDCPNPRQRCVDGKFQFRDGDKCAVYCEVRRTGYMGPETEAPAPYGQAHPPGVDLQLQEGIETSVSYTIGASLSATFLNAIGLGINFEYSTSTAKAKSIARIVEASKDDKYQWSRWVYFPLLIETCGDLMKFDKISKHFCSGDIRKLENICSIGPWIVDGDAMILWIQRFEDADGNPAPMDRQSDSYKGACNSSQDPDGDGQVECFAPIKVDHGVQQELGNPPVPGNTGKLADLAD